MSTLGNRDRLPIGRLSFSRIRAIFRGNYGIRYLIPSADIGFRECLGIPVQTLIREHSGGRGGIDELQRKARISECAEDGA